MVHILHFAPLLWSRLWLSVGLLLEAFSLLLVSNMYNVVPRAFSDFYKCADINSQKKLLFLFLHHLFRCWSWCFPNWIRMWCTTMTTQRSRTWGARVLGSSQAQELLLQAGSVWASHMCESSQVCVWLHTINLESVVLGSSWGSHLHSQTDCQWHLNFLQGKKLFCGKNDFL